MTSAVRIGCAILAASAAPSEGRAKPLVGVNGQTLVERVTLAGCRSRVTRTAVIVGSRADAVATAVSSLPVDIISNPLWPAGLASAVRLAVGWARGRRYDGVLLAMVDEVSLSTPLLDALVAASDGAQQIVGAEQEGIVGLPALFPSDCYARLEEAAGALGGRAPHLDGLDGRALLHAADPDFPGLAVKVPRKVALGGSIQLRRSWTANDVFRGT